LLTRCGDPAAGSGRLVPERAAQQRGGESGEVVCAGKVASRGLGVREQRWKTAGRPRRQIQAGLTGKQRQGGAFESPIRLTDSRTRSSLSMRMRDAASIPTLVAARASMIATKAMMRLALTTDWLLWRARLSTPCAYTRVRSARSRACAPMRWQEYCATTTPSSKGCMPSATTKRMFSPARTQVPARRWGLQ
jgi:hypothetical protein